MPRNPSFLPSTLQLEGSWEQILNDLYSVFNTDFKKHTPNHDGLLVNYDRRILPDGDGKEEGFWHVTSYIDYKSGIAASIYTQHIPFNHYETTSLFEKFSEIVYSQK